MARGARIAVRVAIVLGIALVASVVVLSISLANRKSVLVEAMCRSDWGHTPNGERLTRCREPHRQILIDGREGSSELYALAPGTHVEVKVSEADDYADTVGCKIMLVGYQRTLVERWGRESVTCTAVIP